MTDCVWDERREMKKEIHRDACGSYVLDQWWGVLDHATFRGVCLEVYLIVKESVMPHRQKKTQRLAFVSGPRSFTSDCWVEPNQVEHGGIT